MQQAADQWLDTPVGQVLAQAPLAAGEPARSDGLRERLREAYLAGYQDGRRRD